MALPTGSDPKIARRMRSVKHIVIVLSGKGGVGKSSVAAQLALSLSSTSSTSATGGARVGILDLDLTGPSIPRMLGLDGQSVRQSSDGWVPVYADREQRLAVMSTGFLLRNRNDSVVWRGPKKNAMVRQFLADVRWGDLDYLVVDTPPGTSDEHISLLEYLRGYNPCAVMVTTPQAVSLADNLRSLDFTRKTSLPLLGLIENMSGYVCPHCTECTNVWGRGGGEALAEREGIHFLGRIPIDPGLVRVLDDAKEEAVKSSGDAATALERINEPLPSLKDTRQHADADASVASSQADQPAVPGDVTVDEPAAVLAGTTLSRTLIQRYRESQTFPVFQSITREIIALADERQTTANLAAISVS